MKNKIGQFLEYCDNVVYHPEYMAKTKTRYVINLLIVCPIIWVCGLFLCVVGFCYLLSLFGLLIAAVLYSEGNIIGALSIIGFDIFILILYIREQLKEKYQK